MVIVRIIYISIFFVLLFKKSAIASIILDYETEIFVNNIINEIKDINDINRDINFIILSDRKINAYVDHNNILYLTSGLIENCEDYVAFLSVIGHEIGHIDKNHIKQRKINNVKLKNINTLSNLSVIASSMISNDPAILQGLAINSAGITQNYINFSKNQETEADFYSLETLDKLNLYSNSIIKLLKTIEKKGLEKGFTKEQQKKSTHPYFEERINIINFLNENKGSRFDKKINEKFNFIQAKFLGYSGNKDKINELKEPFKKYAKSILLAKDGNLKASLIELNQLISQNKNNIYLVETKADILFSYGYTNESLEFYKKVKREIPSNNYAQIKIFENTKFINLTDSEKLTLFNENLNLLRIYYNNKNILLSYSKLAKDLNKKDWINFFDYWLRKKNDNENIKIKLSEFKDSEDKDLKKIIDIIYKAI